MEILSARSILSASAALTAVQLVAPPTVSTNVPGADGNFSISVTNGVNPNAPQRLYLLQLQ